MGKGERVQRERSMLDNGSLLLEELIASCDGRSNPIRSFSAEEIIKATNNFDSHHLVTDRGGYRMYKGSSEDRPVMVKKFDYESTLYDISSVIRDIVIGSQMSNHKNVLKLLGCCLEFKIPALVCEYAGDGVLADHLYGSRPDSPSLSWKSRIRIAKEIANAVAYLHTALPRPIIHRDVSPAIVFLDEHGVAKLSDFSLSISIPLGETQVEDTVKGTPGFLDPEYYITNYVTEKADVYSFGMLLLVLLTGRKCVDRDGDRDRGLQYGHILNYVKDNVENDRFNDIVDPKILGEGGGIEQERQLQAFLELAFICSREQGADRPTMIEVAKELMRIERSIAILPC